MTHAQMEAAQVLTPEEMEAGKALFLLERPEQVEPYLDDDRVLFLAQTLEDSGLTAEQADAEVGRNLQCLAEEDLEADWWHAYKLRALAQRRALQRGRKP